MLISRTRKEENKMETLSDDVIEIARRAVAFINLGHVEDPSLYAKDVQFHTPLAGTLDGVDEVARMMVTFSMGFPNHEMRILEAMSDGDRAIFRWEFTGRHEGDLMGIPATGKPVKFGGVNIFRITNGQIQEIWECANYFLFFQQIGLVTSPW
jgi:steroid delta-isomerase-like uncharacterized protein